MNTRMQDGGFAYAEVLVAALMVALLAMPAADAIKNGINANRVSQTKSGELRCVRNQMETVLAEPYLSLNRAAGTANYNLAADGTCDVRTVTITRKLFDGANLTDLLPNPDPIANAIDVQQQTALLLVRVSMKNSDYAFSTVVAR